MIGNIIVGIVALGLIGALVVGVNVVDLSSAWDAVEAGFAEVADVFQED